MERGLSGRFPAVFLVSTLTKTLAASNLLVNTHRQFACGSRQRFREESRKRLNQRRTKGGNQNKKCQGGKIMYLRDWVELGLFILLQIAFVLFGGGFVVMGLFLPFTRSWLVIASIQIGVVLLEIVVVGKMFLLDPLQEILADDGYVPHSISHEALGWFPGHEGRYKMGWPMAGLFKYRGSRKDCTKCSRGEIHSVPRLA